MTFCDIEGWYNWLIYFYRVYSTLRQEGEIKVESTVDAEDSNAPEIKVKIKGFSLFYSQIIALLRKRLVHFRRKILMYIILLVSKFGIGA